MRRFRYDTWGTWYRGNVHLHSTASDGQCAFRELAQLYADAGYDFLVRTDHWVASDTRKDTEAHPLLWLDGIELDGVDRTAALMHVLCIGRVEGIRPEDGLDEGIRQAREQGALCVLAHPTWSANGLDDTRRWDLDGVEVYNHVCSWLNGKSDGLAHWNHALRKKADTLAFAVDDTHRRPACDGWRGGWICVNAPDRRPDSLLQAMRRGNFYASCGPEIRDLRLEGGTLRLETSPVRFVRLAGPGPSGMRVGSWEGELRTETRLTLPGEWDYMYVELEDERGRRAWTNTLFRGECDAAGAPTGSESENEARQELPGPPSRRDS